ncbi:NAD(P)-binding protein [Kineococcus sp. T90]|nr:NAD(P)-binding protein [Kineococcus indalonis]
MVEEHVDVLVVGAGLSGIGAACQLRRLAPGLTFAVLEARERLGGTWDLFRYPGVRSDSDMFTLGYSFRPWTDRRAIADAASIRAYLADTAREFGVDRAIRYGHRLVAADFDTARGLWRVRVERTGGTGTTTTTMTCGFLFACTGYYRYDRGHTPDLPGREGFGGRVVHPQHWPEDLDVAGRRVAVIGSGATAVTLVPALAERGARVTMVQRSPTWIASLPSTDRRAGRWPHRLVRARRIALGAVTYELSRRAPRFVGGRLLREARARLPRGYDMAHFTPRYAPWDQRLCVVPDGDLFEAIGSGAAQVVTGAVGGFTPGGLRLADGREVDADVVVTATGLAVSLFDGVHLAVDGAPVDVARTVAYKGAMLSGVPNFAFAFGYTNASWTLKVDLVTEFVCRLLLRMRRTGATTATPQAPPDPARAPLIDLASGYVRRGAAALPSQGTRTPWRLHQDYLRDVLLLRHRRVDDRGLRLSTAPLAGARPDARAGERAGVAP